MIERNEILLDGCFSWSQVYHLWMEQHDISGKRDKMARSVLRSIIEKSDEQIIGIHSPAPFSVAFPKIYDIVKHYADERTQKEQKNKQWCQLYLPKLQDFISENFPDKYIDKSLHFM